MPTPKHDVAQLYGPGFNTRPKFIYFESMFLGLWLKVTSKWDIWLVFLQDIWLKGLVGLWSLCMMFGLGFLA
jgi:hypothetical protein